MVQLTPSPDASTSTAKLVRWVEVHWTNVLLVVLDWVIPSVENLPGLLLSLSNKPTWIMAFCTQTYM